MNQFAILMTAFTFFCVGASFSLIYTSSVIREDVKVIKENTEVIKELKDSCKK